MKYRFTCDGTKPLLDFLSERLTGVGLSALKNQLARREIRVNGVRTAENVRLLAGDLVEAFLPQRSLGFVQSPGIVFEDGNLLIADKPARTDVEHNLVSALSSEHGPLRPVHRLDRNTTGLVILAKNAAAFTALTEAVKAHGIRKFYRAWLVGSPPADSGAERAYLKKDAEKSLCVVSGHAASGFVPIETKYRVLRREDGRTLTEIQTVTGRTHQIRAHTAFLGCPVLGDGKYGDAAANKRFGTHFQQLRAVRLVFDRVDSPLEYLCGKEITVHSVD